MLVPASTLDGHIDASNVIKNGFTTSDTYTPTVNGFLTGYVIYNIGQGANTTNVKVDGEYISVTRTQITLPGQTNPSDVSTIVGICAPVKAGQTITTGGYGTYTSMKFVGEK